MHPFKNDYIGDNFANFISSSQSINMLSGLEVLKKYVCISLIWNATQT